MIRRTPRTTRTDTLFPYTTLFRSRLVVLPQALKKMAPLMVTQGVILFQDTSLVYVVSLHDFMTATSIVANTQNRIVEMYVFAAVVFFILCTLGSMLARSEERRVGRECVSTGSSRWATDL